MGKWKLKPTIARQGGNSRTQLIHMNVSKFEVVAQSGMHQETKNQERSDQDLETNKTSKCGDLELGTTKNVKSGDWDLSTKDHDDSAWHQGSPTKPFPIFNIPAELRNNVWDIIISEELRMERSERFSRDQIDGGILLRICFQGTIETLNYTTRSLLVGMANHQSRRLQQISTEFTHRLVMNYEITFNDPRTMMYFFSLRFPLKFIRSIRFVRIWVHSTWQWIDSFRGDLS